MRYSSIGTHWLLFALALICSSTSRATEYYVRSSGDDGQAGTTRSTAFRSLSKVASVAGHGDTVYLGAGTYDDSGYFDAARKPGASWLTIHGDVDGQHTGDRGDVVIRSLDERWGIHVQNARSVRVSGVSLRLAFRPRVLWNCDRQFVRHRLSRRLHVR